MCGTDSTTTTSAPPRSLPRIGDKAPDFTAASTMGEIRFGEWQGDRWVILFSHPADFTPVCSTELTGFARRADEFEALDCQLIGVSVDSIHSHLAWNENLAQILDTRLPYPLIADSDRQVSERFGMIHPGESATVTVRALFFIDPQRTIRTIIYYPLNIGRSIDEVLRVLKALQMADGNGVACPANWQPGDRVIVPPPKTVAEVDERKTGDYDEKIDFYLVKKSIEV